MSPAAGPAATERPLGQSTWMLSAIAAVVAIAVAALVIPMYFSTNDDAYAIQVLSGGGGVAAEPLPCVDFINYVLCLLISRLYALTTDAPWWSIFQLIMLALSFTVIGRALVIARREQGRPWPVIMELVCLTVLDFALVAYFVGRMHFTNTASLLMAAAIVASCAPMDGDHASQGVGSRIILPACLAIAGYAMRAQSGYLGLFFWVLTIVALVFREEGALRERLRAFWRSLAGLGLAAAVILVLLVAHNLGMVAEGMASDDPPEASMSLFTDYPRTPYDKDPELYEAVGWDRELVQLAGDYWFMMDERVNPDALAYINSHNTEPVDQLLNHPVATMSARLHYVSQPVAVTNLALTCAVVVTAFSLASRRGERLTLWVVTVAMLAFLGYLLIRGRLLERAAYAVTLPATGAFLCAVLHDSREWKEANGTLVSLSLATLLCVGALALVLPLAPIMGKMAAALGMAYCIVRLVRQVFILRSDDDGSFVRVATIGAMALACMVALAPGIVTVKKYGVGSWDAQSQAASLANTESLFAYVDEHPDTLYITAGCNTNIQYVWQGRWPVNQTGWGGWRWKYEWCDEAMRAAGFDGLPTSEDFFDDNVRFVSANESICDLLLRYMRNTFGEDVQMEQVDTIDGGMSVYRFVRQ